jgi:hypothetical protein
VFYCTECPPHVTLGRICTECYVSECWHSGQVDITVRTMDGEKCVLSVKLYRVFENTRGQYLYQIRERDNFLEAI